MRKIYFYLLVATVLLGVTACSLFSPLISNPTPTRPPVIVTLTHKQATPTPTLGGREVPPTPTKGPTLSPEQFKTCMSALPVDMPATVKQMANGAAQGALPLVACDNFIDNSNGWSVGSWNGTYVQGVESLKDGVLGLKGVSADGGVWYDFPQASPNMSDFTLVIDARILNSPAATQVGIFYRYDGDNFYMASVSATMYEFYLFQNGDWVKLLDATPFPASFDDSTKPGWITLEVKGDTHTLYFNNERVDSIQDNRLTFGNVGVGIELDSGSVQTTVEFYHFILRGE